MDKRVDTLTKHISLKVNIFVQLGFKFAYFKDAVQHFSHYTTENPLTIQLFVKVLYLSVVQVLNYMWKWRLIWASGKEDYMRSRMRWWSCPFPVCWLAVSLGLAMLVCIYADRSLVFFSVRTVASSLLVLDRNTWYNMTTCKITTLKQLHRKCKYEYIMKAVP